MYIRIFFALFALAAAGCSSTPNSTDTSIQDDEPIAAQSATLIVQGMSCPLCATNVDKQLLAIRGVHSAVVDLGTGEVNVEFSNLVAHPTREQLEQAIIDSGYTLAEIKTH